MKALIIAVIGVVVLVIAAFAWLIIGATAAIMAAGHYME
jgi:hypothetical protein